MPIGTGCTEPAVGDQDPGQPGGAAPADRAMFGSGADVPGRGVGTPWLSPCLEQGSCCRSAQAEGAQVAGDKPLAVRPHVGKLVLGLS